MSRYPNSGQNQNIRIANESFENVAKFKYLGTTLTNQNDIRDEIKNRLNSGNACYHPVQNLLSSRLISKNLKIKIYKTVMCRLCCMGAKLGLSLWGRNIDYKGFFLAQSVEEDGSWRKLRKMSFITCILRQILLG
jgi:hypothetical protein